MKNIVRTIIASIKFTTFWIAIIVQLPIIILAPRGKWMTRYSNRVFWPILMGITGVRHKVFGKLSSARPLLLVSNHISVFEFATFSMAFGGSFFGKAEIEKYPLVGWIAKKIGVIFVDRNPRTALDAIAKIQKTMASVSYPMTLFPEGMTTTGTYIAPFKSSMFNFIEDGANVTVQPIVMIYRDKRGNKIPDKIMSAEYADYDPARQIVGECVMRKKTGVAFGTVFHIMKLGGLVTELHILPPPPLAGMDRKQIADTLHQIVSKEFYKLK